MKNIQDTCRTCRDGDELAQFFNRKLIDLPQSLMLALRSTRSQHFDVFNQKSKQWGYESCKLRANSRKVLLWRLHSWQMCQLARRLLSAMANEMKRENRRQWSDGMVTWVCLVTVGIKLCEVCYIVGWDHDLWRDMIKASEMEQT